MSYQFYNAHPKGLFVGDCVKRAISKAANMDYMEVQRALNRHKKITGCANYFDHNHGTHYVEHVLKGTPMSFPAVKGQPRMNGERFCKAYPKGNYILSMAGHLSCCVDGVIYDTWDCTDKCVYKAYKVEPVVPHYYMVKGNNVLVYDKDKGYCNVIENKDERKGFCKALEQMGFELRR